MKTIHKTTLGLLFFLGFTSILGSWGLISDTSGETMGFPPELLAETPFDNYLIPGIILLLAMGIFSLFISYQILKNRNYYPQLVIAQGLILIIWLSAQLTLNPEFYFPLLHIPYFILGILLIVMGIKLRQKVSFS